MRVQDQVGWRQAHVVGFSMGGMVACTFATLYPASVLSLTTVSSTLGHWHAIPRSRKAWKYVVRAAVDSSRKTRANTDLNLHFTKRALHQCAPRSLQQREPCMHVTCGGSAAVHSSDGRFEGSPARGQPCLGDLLLGGSTQVHLAHQSRLHVLHSQLHEFRT